MTAAMTPEQRRQFRIYGDHTIGCAERIWRDGKWVESVRVGDGPEQSWDELMSRDCDCGWLEALGAACKGEGE